MSSRIRHWTCCLWTISTSCLIFALANAQDDEILFADCSVDTYYQRFQGRDPSSWTRSDMAELLRETHRRPLPYTSSSREDVWDALIDLDRSSQNDDDGSVHLIYRQTDVPIAEYGTPSTWNREHLWPKSRGVGTSGPDYTDIHALRPADWNVNSARSNLFFGNCLDECTDTPATPEAAPDTAKNGTLFLPPASVRGDIARALLYMELRYSFEEDGTSALELTDCPGDDNDDTAMAYLSELLAWHAEDPIDEQELLRNDRACARWQGNRNIFVDFPELAAILHGVPASKPYRCKSPTAAPSSVNHFPPITTSSPSSAPTLKSGANPDSAPNAALRGCTDLVPGDVQVIAFNSDNPDAITLVALENLPSDLDLYITDNAWTGSSFQSNEGTLKFQVPSEGIAQGSVFGYGEASLAYNDLWQSVGRAVALATAGDSIIVYCRDDNDDPVHLGAFVTGQWKDGGLDYTSNESALPESLSQVGATSTVSKFDNYAYEGIISGTKAALLEALGDSANWRGDSNERLVFKAESFVVVEDSESLGAITLAGWGCVVVYLSLVRVVFLTLFH